MIPEPAEFEEAPPPVKARPAKVNGVHREESFENARPVHIAPHPEAELLSCCLLDAHTLEQAAQAGISHASFTTSGRQTIFRRMQEIHEREHSLDTTLLVAELKRHGDFKRIGGYAGITQETPEVSSSLNARSLIQTIRNDEIRREIIRISELAKARANEVTDPEELLSELALQFRPKPAAREAPLLLAPRPLTDFTYPKDDDPDILLGADDYLGRGGGMLFVSHAGAGKSSWIMDACMSWAIGLEWCGIVTKHPRKILIVQGEDSDRYVGKVVTSFIHARKLTTEQQTLLSTNCRMVRLKGVAGLQFFGQLQKLVQAEQPDLVVINPLYIYAEGDIGKSEHAQPFLMNLDAINKDEKFAYILVHHTGKPQARGRDGKRAEIDDWESVYMGFGSSYLANWPRCSALLEPVPDSPGRYRIKLGKGGFNAGVTKKVEHGAGWRLEPTTRIAIRHSTDKMRIGERDRPVYYWEMDTEPEVTEPKTKGGRPQKYSFSEFAASFPRKTEPPIRIAELHRRVGVNVPGLKPNALYNLVQRFVKDGSLEEVVLEQGATRAYRMAV